MLDWGRRYTPTTFANDATAALIVTVMLIPQSLAYALLAGLPPEVGLYASILPLVAYALFGTSRTLSVGPVAVVSLMSAAAVAKVAEPGSPEFLTAALLLATLSGLILVLAGVLRLGFLANFLSHPVVSGFITASGILIAASQLRHLLGVPGGGHELPGMLATLGAQLGDVHGPTLAIGLAALVFLFWARGGAKKVLVRLGLGERAATTLARAAPALAVLLGIGCAATLDLEAGGVRVVGEIPGGLPSLALPAWDPALWRSLAGSALLISLVGFVESISVARTFAARRRQRIAPDQELVGLGAANLASGFSGGFAVTGGFSRSAVNFDAGAETPAAGVLTAIGIALATLYLAPWLYYLPIAVLAATIIVAVLSLVDVATLRHTWHYSRGDFAAALLTILVTLTEGVELGIATGVGVSIALHLWNTSRPHFAIVGQVPGTEHFRNVERHDVITSERVLTIRVDESLYFANASFLEERVMEAVAERPSLSDVVLMCPAVNRIDASGLDGLEAIRERLADSGIRLHLSEVKGPVMDRLKDTDFLRALGGRVYLHQHEAMRELDAESSRRAAKSGPDDAAPITPKPLSDRGAKSP